MVGGTSRRDSWDAIAKTKSLLSYGSLESLANLANNSSANDHTITSSNFTNNNNNNYRIKNYTESNSQDVSVNHNSSQKVQTTSEYTSSAIRYNGNQNEGPRTHGILKNKDYNSYKGIDTTDATHERFIGNNGSAFRPTRRDKLVTGDALDILPVHRPTTFALDSSVDASKATVRVTGEGERFNNFVCLHKTFHSNSK